MPPRLNKTRLAEAAKELGDTTQYQIHKRTGVAESTLSRLWNGLVEPRHSTLKRLARPYPVTASELLDDEDDEEEDAA